MQLTSMRSWLAGAPQGKSPILISGPCSAESREQVLASCKGVAEQGAHLLRAGIWKPRTRPGSFEGVGEVGLPWLAEAGRITGLPTCCEVAKAEHVEAALKAGIDVLWIGARTSVNPFAVQEVADALQGVDVPVMVKNPVNPDLPLWIGALERLYKAGIDKLAAIHRGFSVSNAAPYRNLPIWYLPIDLRRELPDLTLINDPSHIAGRRSLLLQIAQKALDLDFDGWMIESHINPEVALSDAAQQVTPRGLRKLLDSLVYRTAESEDPEFKANLEALRYDIDNIDQQLFDLMAQRMEVAREIGKYKKANNVQILQMDRWRHIFATRSRQAAAGGLNDRFAEQVLQALHEESIQQQTHVMMPDEAAEGRV